jgi:hypothetical protein
MVHQKTLCQTCEVRIDRHSFALFIARVSVARVNTVPNLWQSFSNYNDLSSKPHMSDMYTYITIAPKEAHVVPIPPWLNPLYMFSGVDGHRRYEEELPYWEADGSKLLIMTPSGTKAVVHSAMRTQRRMYDRTRESAFSGMPPVMTSFLSVLDQMMNAITGVTMDCWCHIST